MINIQKFKRHIIQLALEGKLTKQSANESADALVQLLKKGNKKYVKFSEELIHFNIPSNWKWCMVYEAVSLDNGQEISSRELPYLDAKYLRTGNNPAILNKGFLVKKGEKVILVDGENSGEVFHVKEDGYRGSTFKILNISNAFVSEYVLYFISLYKENFRENKTGSAIPHLNKTIFFELPIPLPPLEEQKRIVGKINELFSTVDTISSKINDSIALKEKLKNRILDLAIRGKLVDQRASEQAVNELLANIDIQKKYLIRNGQVKAFKKASTIRQEEIPFDIPYSWKWVRLSDICTKIVDGDHNPPSGVDRKTDYLMISAINVNNDRICELNRVRYLDEDTFKIEDERTKLKKGDILLTIVGTMGRSCIYDGELNLAFQRSVSVITTLINNEYLKRVFDSSYIQKFMEFNSTGTAQKGFYLNQVSSLLIPVPPLEEQKRIVDKINEIISLL